MKSNFSLFVAVLIFSIVLYGCHAPATQAPAQLIDTRIMDSSTKPGDNFYLFANGKWLKNTVIPATESQQGAILELYNRTKARLHSILDSLAGGTFEKGSLEQKVGDFYASGMDSVSIEKLGYAPVKPLLAQIDALNDAGGIMAFVAAVSKQLVTVKPQQVRNNLLIGFVIGPDDKNSSYNIVALSQAGLGLPDRDYYFKEDAATRAVVKAYQEYIVRLLMLTGDDSSVAEKQMKAVYDLEKQMAASHKSNVDLRDPQSNYHKMAVAGLDKEMPVIGWRSLFDNLGFKVDSANVQQPAFYAKLNGLLKTVPIGTWKADLRFHILSNAAGALSTPFARAQFDFTKTLTGQQ